MRKRAGKVWDVLVAGGGLVGAALAVALGRRGFSTVLVEARPLPKRPGRSPERMIALSFGSRLCLEQFGVWDAVAAGGAVPIRHVHVHEPGNPGAVRMHHTEAGIEALGCVISHDRLLQVLYDCMPESVRVLAPARVRTCESAEDRVTIGIEKGRRSMRILCRLLVAADGTDSRLRRLCGLGSYGWDHNRFGLVAEVRAEKPHKNVAYECFRPSGPLAFLPLDPCRYSVVWTLPPREAAWTMRQDDTGFLRELEQSAGDYMRGRLGGLAETGPRACIPFEYRLAENFTAGRMALVGNAAHALHPVAGQGLNLGLRDIMTLLDLLVAAREDGRDLGAPVLLEAYRQRRWPDTLAVSLFTEGLNLIFANDLMPLRLLRGIGLLTMDRLPGLKDWLMHRTTGLAQARVHGG